MIPFPAATTDLEGLHDLLASTQAVTQRWLDKAKTKDEPPSITDIANLTLSTRRIALLHRDIYRLENPSLAFPQSHNRARARNLNPDSSSPFDPHDPNDLSDPVNPNDPDILSKNSSSTPLTYSREISRYVAARIVASIKSKPEDAADCCPHLYEEMDLMKSNPAYHAETLADMSATPAPANSPDPVDPEILSKKSASENSVALCENSSSSPVDPPDPVILSDNPSDSSELHSSNFSLHSSRISDPADSVNPSANPVILSKHSPSSSSFRDSPSAIRDSSRSPSPKYTLQTFLARSRAGPDDP